MKRLLAIAMVSALAATGCGSHRCWRNDCGWDGGSDFYGSFDDGIVYNQGNYPAYLPSDGTIVGPEMLYPGETVPRPAGEPLPGPAQ